MIGYSASKFATITLQGDWIAGLHYADVNGDSLGDIIFGAGWNQFSILPATSSLPSFGLPYLGTSRGFGVEDSVFADINNDGKIDVAAITQARQVGIFYNNSSGVFNNSLNYESNFDDGYLVSSDINADGSVDLLKLSWHRAQADFYVNSSSSGLASNALFLNGSIEISPRQKAQLLDWDQDGYKDIAWMSANQSAIVLSRGSNLGFLPPFVAYNFTTPNNSSSDSPGRLFHLMDANRDGLLDIIVSDGSNRLFFIENSSNGFLDPKYLASLNVGGHINEFQISDLNNDGDIDLIIRSQYLSVPGADWMGSTDSLSVIYGTPSALTSTASTIASEWYGWLNVIFSDVNGDGVKDFIWGGHMAGNAIIYTGQLDAPQSTIHIAPENASKAEGNTGSTPFTFTVTRTGDTSVAHTASWAVSGSGTNPATAADFVGGVLPAGTVSFGVGQTSQTITVLVAGDSAVEADEGFTITISNPSAGLTVGTATATGTIINDDSALPTSPSISGVVYHWKSHALLSGVTVSAESSSSGSTSTALQFRDVRTDASGNVLVDLWGNGASGVGNFGADLSLGTGITASFQSSLPGDWTVLQNGGTGSLSLAGFGLTSVSGSTKLGTLTFTKSSAATPFNVSLQSGEYGTLSATPLSLGYLSDVTGADGAFQIDVGVGNYTVDASRGVGDVGRAITSADALAALRLAVGLNPNSDPDGDGPLQPMRVSPYQFLAADVNNSGTITSVDALIILRMAVRLADAPQAEWLFLSEQDTFWNASTSSYSVTRSAVPNAELPMSMTVNSAVTQNLVGVLTGDVNGSWRPLDGNGNALVDGAYPALPDSYFVALSSTLAVPTDLWGI